MIIIILCVFPNSVYSYSDEQIKVFAPWQDGDKTIRVVILNEAGISNDKMDIIKKVITSDVSYQINGQTYFEGWSGALDSISTDKVKRFEISESKRYAPADISIILLNESNPEYNGLTKPIFDGNHVISATIQIFAAHILSSSQLENLLRHEFGHALGLGHSTYEGSVMYPTMSSTAKKFISACDLEGLKAAHAGQTFIDVRCSQA